MAGESDLLLSTVTMLDLKPSDIHLSYIQGQYISVKR